MTVREPSLVSGTDTHGKASLGTLPTSRPPPLMANPGLWGLGVSQPPCCALRVSPVTTGESSAGDLSLRHLRGNPLTASPGVSPSGLGVRGGTRGAGALRQPLLGRDKVTSGCWLTQAKPNLAGGCFKPC